MVAGERKAHALIFGRRPPMCILAWVSISVRVLVLVHRWTAMMMIDAHLAYPWPGCRMAHHMASVAPRHLRDDMLSLTINGQTVVDPTNARTRTRTMDGSIGFAFAFASIRIAAGSNTRKPDV